MANRAKHYRRRARECLKLVNVVPRGEAHHTIIAMAREWTHPRGKQQQIQPDDK